MLLSSSGVKSLGFRNWLHLGRFVVRKCSTKKARTIFDFSSRTDCQSMVRSMMDRFLIYASFPDTLMKDLSPLSSIPKIVYAGFDPTADSLHIGHLLVVNSLLHFYAAGFDVIALVGGATANLGDPSGRLTERDSIQREAIIHNSESIMGQLKQIFANFRDHCLVSPEQKAQLKPIRIINNAQWYKNMNVIDFVSDIGPRFRLRHMLHKETVRLRQDTKEGMHFAEFAYQIFQAYDWLRLYEETGCLLQIGGSDQIGNIHSGHDLIRRTHGKDAFGFVAPLLTNVKGEKLGKSTMGGQTGSAVWLDDGKTSPFEFYQHFTRLPDAEVAKYLYLFTFLPLEEVESISSHHERNPEKRTGQTKVASELTVLAHGSEGLSSAQRCTDVLYNGSMEKLIGLSDDEFRAIFSGVPTLDLKFRNDVTVHELAMQLPPFMDAGERAALDIIKNGGFYVNYQRIREPHCVLVSGVHTLPNGSTVVRTDAELRMISYSYTAWNNDELPGKQGYVLGIRVESCEDVLTMRIKQSPRIRAIAFLYVLWMACPVISGQKPSITSPEDSAVNAIKGFGTDLQCFVNSCAPPGKKVKWYKDGQQISDGIVVTQSNSRYSIRHNVDVERRKACRGSCSSTRPCAAGYYCVDNACCVCNKEEFTLMIYNVTSDDRGTYQCKLDGSDEDYVEFRLNILDGGISPTFSENITFDYSGCCREQGMSDGCMAMCKPKTLQAHKFDPVTCHNELGKLLQCASQNGSTSHTHCCRLQFVPQFCWQLCSTEMNNFETANALCLFWIPEIFQCYEQVYLPLPGYPERLLVTAVNSSTVRACWEPPRVRSETVDFYTVRYQEMPHLPFFGSPMGDDYEEDEEELPRLPHDHRTDEDEDNEDERGVPRVRWPGGGWNKGPVRKKRQALIITTHNFDTNETDIREYRPQEINTTDTCALIIGLKPATHYSLYVKAVNDYGAGLPSTKATTVTANVELTNVTVPNVQECCSKRGVLPDCASRLCDITQPPGAFSAFNVALTCRSELPKVAPCLADGRDHTDCCIAKNVGRECLKMCNGTTSEMSSSSVLCLSLDMTSIYNCLHEGYDTHPSPPTNVSVDRITGTSVVISWNAPKDNAEKVISYSMFYREGYDEEYTEVANVTSPYELNDLRPDTLYSVYMIAYTPRGKSLRSTTLSFYSGEQGIDGICVYGQPLLDAYGDPVQCGGKSRCPEFFECVDSENDDEDAFYCCPQKPLIEPNSDGDLEKEPNFTTCCEWRGVSESCLKMCSYEATKDELTNVGPDCVLHLQTWLECGGGGRDNRPCCESEHVPDSCLDFCSVSPDDPFEVSADHVPCLDFVQNISKCSAEGIGYLPGPPRYVRHLVEGPTWASVRWDKPWQITPVDHYEVHFYDDSQERVLNTSALSVTINDLKKGPQYAVKVRSVNARGTSVFSPVLNFTLDEDTLDLTEDFPSQPSKVNVEWYRNGTANVSWTWDQQTFGTTGKKIALYEFNVSYGESLENGSRVNWQWVTAKNFSTVLVKLKENVSYDVFVTARDLEKNVEGIPGPVTSFKTRTAKSPPFAEIQTIPDEPFHVGERVELSCIAGGDPVPNVTIEGFGRLMASGLSMATAFFEIASVDDANEDIVCSADNGHYVPFRTTYTLKVRHPPQVYAVADPVYVIQDLVARVTCRIRAYPSAKVNWFFQNEHDRKRKRAPKEIFINWKYDIDEKSGQISNTLNATLTINQAEPKDAGYYYCNACNDMGCTNVSQKLVVEPYPVPPSPDYILDCCKKQNIRPDCMSACTMDIDNDVYDMNLHCRDEFPKLMFCSKDGVDYTECCKRKNVPDQCLPYCDRKLTTNETPVPLESCSDFGEHIINCVNEGHGLTLVPDTPGNLRVRIVNSHSFNISWESLNPDDRNVPLYVLYYKREGDEQYTTARTENMWLLLPNVDTDAEYNFTIIAANRHGFSMFSPLITIRSWPGGFSSGLRRARSAAGTALAVLFFLCLGGAVIAIVIYFTRRPQKLSDLLQKLRGNNWTGRNPRNGGAVAFENPGYDTEAQVRVLPANGNTSANPGTTNGSGVAWERAELETPENAVTQQQRGMRYTQFS